MITLADTGAIYALHDRADDWHGRVLAWWQVKRREVLLPVTTLPEITYLLQTRIGSEAERAFVGAVAAGEFVIEPLEDQDIERAAELLDTYGDVPLGFVDAMVVAQAERLRIMTLLTTDRRHFSLVRPRHAAAFQLEP